MMEQLDKSIWDRRVSAKVKRKVYRTWVRPAMMSGLETLAIGRGGRVKDTEIVFRSEKAGQDQERGH